MLFSIPETSTADMKTIFIDIDGTIIKQKNNLSDIQENLELCDGVLDKFNQWNWNNYKIILITGRKESTREVTEKSLKSLGLFWDHLIMGLDAGGCRYLINNRKYLDHQDTCYAINVNQDEGLKSLNI